jgi:hypothetical protein
VTSGVQGSDSRGQRGEQKNGVESLSVGEPGRVEFGGRRKKGRRTQNISEKRSDLGVNRVLA